jgi:acetyl-CoA carboxylase carboxyl transferase subunit alpha
LGGAHRDPQAMTTILKKALFETLRTLQSQPIDDLLQARFKRLMAYGRFKEVGKK